MNRRTFLTRLLAAPFVAALAALGWQRQERPAARVHFAGRTIDFPATGSPLEYDYALKADDLNADFDIAAQMLRDMNQVVGEARREHERLLFDAAWPEA